MNTYISNCGVIKMTMFMFDEKQETDSVVVLLIERTGQDPYLTTSRNLKSFKEIHLVEKLKKKNGIGG